MNPDDDRLRDELHGGAEPCRSEHHQNHPGHHRRHEEAIDAVPGDDARDDNDEGTGRSANLEVGSAERRDEESRDDGAV
ncbi:MAG: hypothetical protein QM736_20090 [Vicinamibacterales bacterium]